MKACLELVKQAIGNFCTVKVIQVAELHEGVCDSHVGGRSLAHRAMTQGFWWPQMQKDAMEYVRKCKRCQKHAPLIHQPTGNLNPISSPWPFAQYGLDILEPFPQATGNQSFVLVAVNYFTKWAKAEALANIRDIDVKKLVWNNITTRFGVSNSLISDNKLQFDSRAFCEFLKQPWYQEQVFFSSVSPRQWPC